MLILTLVCTVVCACLRYAVYLLQLPRVKAAEFDPDLTNSIAKAENVTMPPACVPSSWLGRYDFGNAFYSFDAASAHFVVLTQYTSSAPGSNQMK